MKGKKLGECKDLRDGDIVVIAGVRRRIHRYPDGYMYIHKLDGMMGGISWEFFEDMTVDEVIRAGTHKGSGGGV